MLFCSVEGAEPSLLRLLELLLALESSTATFLPLCYFLCGIYLLKVNRRMCCEHQINMAMQTKTPGI